MDAQAVRAVHDRLLDDYGPQHWWPAASPFEVMVGAVLVQNAAWTRAERGIARLAGAGALSVETLLALPGAELAALIRPAGCPTVKARRLRSLAQWLEAGGGFDVVSRLELAPLRAGLLSVHGIGPETADAILLYAFARPVFVVDGYARRLFGRLGVTEAARSYAELGAWFEARLPRKSELFNEYHALIVRHGRARCRARRPACATCPLADLCPRTGVERDTTAGALFTCAPRRR